MTEALEGRVLLAATPTPAASAKSHLLAKVASSLSGVFQEFKAHKAKGAKAGKFMTRDPLLHVMQERVSVEVFAAKGQGATLERDLKKLGLTRLQRFGSEVTGLLPLGTVDRLAALRSVKFARPVWSVTHAVTGQSDRSMRADRARTTYGVDGTGVRVGILSDSFDGSSHPIDYAADIASGDLPNDVVILEDSPGESDEGRAMAQLIYDTAPGADLRFATAGFSEAEFAENIRALRYDPTSRAQVIVDDVTFLAEPMFQDGKVARAVEEVVLDGAAYFSAAGNMGVQSYESGFRTGRVHASGSIPSAFDAPLFVGGLSHDFNPDPVVLDDRQGFTLPAGGEILLSFQWDQPFFSIDEMGGSSANDMDIYVLNAAGTQVLAGSTIDNIESSGDPVEVFSFVNTTGAEAQFNLMMLNFRGANPGLMKYVNFGTEIDPEFKTESGTVYGHSNARGAQAIGSAAWFNTPEFGVSPAQMNDYSASVGTNILFDRSGSRLPTPEVRDQRPLVAAPDGANTTFFGGDVPQDADTLPNFFGTSAAAPSAAAVAALVLDVKDGALTPQQVYGFLESTAGPTDDPDIGFIRADAAVAAAGGIVIGGGNIVGNVFEDKNTNAAVDAGESGQAGVVVYIDANNNAALDAGETSVVTAANGSFSFPNLTAGTYRVRQVPPQGFVQTAPAAGFFSVTVAGSGSFTAGNFANFPIVYNGAAGAVNDSYTLRRDPADNARIQILVGATPTYSAPYTVVPSLAFNLGQGNDTLNVDYTSGIPVPAGGVVYDGRTVGGVVGPDDPNDVLNVTGSNGDDNITLVHPDVGPVAGNIAVRFVDQINVNTNLANDSLTMGQVVFAVVNYNGGAGVDSLSFSAANGNDTDVVVTSTSVTGGGNTANYSGLEQVTVDALAGNDTIQLLSAAVGTDYTIRGGGQDDAATLSPNFSNRITFDGGAGADTFTANGSAGNDAFTVAGFGLNGAGNSVAYPNTETLFVETLAGNDTINVSDGILALSWTVRGGDGNDTITLNQPGVTPLAVDGGAGTDNFIFNASGGDDLVAVAQAAVSGGGNSATYAAIEALTVNAMVGVDGIEVSSTAAGVPVTVNGGNGNDTLTILNAPNPTGPVTFNGGADATDRDTLNVNAGTYTFAADAVLGTAHLTVNVNNGAAVNFNTTQHLAGLNVGQGSTAAVPAGRNKVIVTEALSFPGAAASAGTLDLADNALVLRSTAAGRAAALASLTGNLRSGYNGGAWTGRQLHSSTAAADANRRTALGVVLNDNGAGGVRYTTFRGEGGLGVNDILVGYTLYGDANLSGNVDGSDFALLAGNFGRTGTSWATGDTNFDDRTDGSDFARLAGNFGRVI